MRVLVIDDIRVLGPVNEGVQVHYARTAPEALGLIEEGPWDVVYFDHDLGEKGDVRPVVSFLEEQAFEGSPLPIGRVVVVSSNPAGADWIVAGLSRHYPVTRRFAGPVIVP